jgi:hypothetical protein
LAGATTSATKKSNFAPNSIIERVGCGVVGGVVGASVPITPKLTTINCGSVQHKFLFNLYSWTPPQHTCRRRLSHHCSSPIPYQTIVSLPYLDFEIS